MRVKLIIYFGRTNFKSNVCLLNIFLYLLSSVRNIVAAQINHMPLSSIYDFYSTVKDEKVILSFKSIVTADLLKSTLEIIEIKLEEIEPSKKIRKKVFHLLVECLQNLYHHTEKFDFKQQNLSAENSHSSILIVCKNETAYFIKTGNYIHNNKLEGLKNELLSLNNMNDSELRNHYIETLNDGKRNKQGTAGLGMIDLRRKSGNKLAFQFKPITEDISFFCLKVTIG